MKYSDPLGLVYGLGSSPYSQYYAAQPGQESQVALGGISYISDLLSGFNSHKPGTCEYLRRAGAIKLADGIIEAAKQSGTVREYLIAKISSEVQSNPAYYAGRVTTNSLVSALAVRFGGGKNLGKGPKILASMSLGTALTSKATYSAIISVVENQLPECPCETN